MGSSGFAMWRQIGRFVVFPTLFRPQLSQCTQLRCSSLHCSRRSPTLRITPTSISIHRSFYGSPKSCESVSSTTTGESGGLFRSFIKKFTKLEYAEHKLRMCGVLLYEKCVDGIQVKEFINDYRLPDTYFSWFLITELHVWMVMVRVMNEGEDGRCVRNAIVEAMWRDANTRAQMLSVSSRDRRADLANLNEQFMATLFLYDERGRGKVTMTVNEPPEGDIKMTSFLKRVGKDCFNMLASSTYQCSLNIVATWNNLLF